jgi:hypothetical protein
MRRTSMMVRRAPRSGELHDGGGPPEPAVHLPDGLPEVGLLLVELVEHEHRRRPCLLAVAPALLCADLDALGRVEDEDGRVRHFQRGDDLTHEV